MYGGLVPNSSVVNAQLSHNFSCVFEKVLAFRNPWFVGTDSLCLRIQHQSFLTTVCSEMRALYGVDWLLSVFV